MTPINHTHEKNLLLRLQGGDHKAFDQLYSTYSERIYGRLLRLTACEEIASDILQETFIIVWEKRETVNPDLSFRSWLYRIAENGVYQYYRRVARDTKMQEHIIKHFSELYWHTEEDVICKENKQMLNDIIAQLPEQRRKIFQLCKIDGHSYEEAAKILGISPSTVSNQLVKANTFVKQQVFKNQELTTVILTAFFMSR